MRFAFVGGSISVVNFQSPSTDGFFGYERLSPTQPRQQPIRCLQMHKIKHDRVIRWYHCEMSAIYNFDLMIDFFFYAVVPYYSIHGWAECYWCLSSIWFTQTNITGSCQLIFLSQHVCDKCQTVHFTWKIQQQFDVYCTENSWRDPPEYKTQNWQFNTLPTNCMIDINKLWKCSKVKRINDRGWNILTKSL
jgi:hypothetical protein